VRLTGVLSQREVARRLGISHAHVAQLERSAVNKICRALDLPSPYTHVGGKRGFQRKTGQIRPRTAAVAGASK
jgi:transcriptional regulator with XRE-family HTH domain